MAISLASLQTSTVLRPPRVLIHGVAGIGKSTFAASADAPVFVLTEDGLGKLQVPHFPLAYYGALRLGAVWAGAARGRRRTSSPWP